METPVLEVWDLDQGYYREKFNCDVRELDLDVSEDAIDFLRVRNEIREGGVETTNGAETKMCKGCTRLMYDKNLKTLHCPCEGGECYWKWNYSDNVFYPSKWEG